MPVPRPSGNGITHYAVVAREFCRDGNGSVTGCLNRTPRTGICRAVSRPRPARTTRGPVRRVPSRTGGDRQTVEGDAAVEPATRLPGSMTDVAAPAVRTAT